uniref:Uncharacterized protein n=1 Tax=Timema cristinae TaxID=61476 RepID=A0A7R9GP80_TIMCR|nr:unnamed protein product [Timema cristinae]
MEFMKAKTVMENDFSTYKSFMKASYRVIINVMDEARSLISHISSLERDRQGQKVVATPSPRNLQEFQTQVPQEEDQTLEKAASQPNFGPSSWEHTGDELQPIGRFEYY